jgi:hypothetical protein
MMLHGKSGGQISIVNKNFDFFLRKTSKNIAGNARLVLQAEKQIAFYKQDAFPFVKTPEITNVYAGTANELAFIEMKYIFGKDILSFLQGTDIATINRFIENILSYMDHIFKNVKVGSTESVAHKVEQIAAMTFPRKERIMRTLRTPPKEELLVGECHGDLTMANMIHTDSTMYLVDFLNTYVNSPILDLLSVRQDTYHLWSCHLHETYPCRVVETLKYIDEELRTKYGWVLKNGWYRYLSLMNYVRMYPFNTEKDTTEFINSCIVEYL